MNEKAISQYLSFILRHQPEQINLELDVEGWANINQLIEKSEPVDGVRLSLEIIQSIVQNSDKKRFQISEDGLNIRAVQGHSNRQVQRQFDLKVPPKFLYHGTAERFHVSIMELGLISKERQYVHLSADINTAHAVGERYGKVKILTIDALAMHNKGFQFFQAENGVWLVEHVPVKFII
ncbi:RNA 2'-phosphotransferase [Acinetobacter shaoyimingii]|uniref:Probable RNA 2'-phosphotransferase n=1 Tax=Acinetobacter shaoyimingii TaxID=2715164 RepID=A0A6G8RU75_9GAMM|nr:RNA 2'-phosphotransferase [Acinetobacter shaoyimingii]QIO05476.1 RNA 2'-phosphotransferase [Acinetobacter shaoyimingii]